MQDNSKGRQAAKRTANDRAIAGEESVLNSILNHG